MVDYSSLRASNELAKTLIKPGVDVLYRITYTFDPNNYQTKVNIFFFFFYKLYLFSFIELFFAMSETKYFRKTIYFSYVYHKLIFVVIVRRRLQSFVGLSLAHIRGSKYINIMLIDFYRRTDARRKKQ